MLLWDIIRDWFVLYVFGGTASTGDTASGMMGYGFVAHDGIANELDNASTEHVGVILNGFTDGYDPFVGSSIYPENVHFIISVGDWLSTTATIITLIALCLFLFLAVKWVFNVFRNTLERVGK